MAKVLVMGGSYFIGRHVIDVLKDHYELTVLNRGNHPLNDPDVEELIADRNDASSMNRALNNKPFDMVVDISGYRPAHIHTLLESLNKNNITHYIFISTAAVYDTLNQHPPFKEIDPLATHSPFGAYAYEKIDCEKTLSDTFSLQSLSIIRPPFVYGENNYLLREKLMFHLIDTNQTIYIPRDNPKIQFVYAKDLASSVKALLDETLPKGIYNVGQENPITFREWIKNIEAASGKAATIKWIKDASVPSNHYFPFPNNDFYLDVSKHNAHITIETAIVDALKNIYKKGEHHNVTLPETMIAARQKLKKDG